MIRKILIAIVSQYLFFFSFAHAMDPKNVTGVAHNLDGIRETFRHNITGRISSKPPSNLLPPSLPQTTSTNSQFSFTLQNIDRVSKQLSQTRLLQQEAAQYLNLKDTAQKLIQNQITQFNQRTASTTDFIKLHSIKVELIKNIASLENRIKNIQGQMNHYIHTNHLSHETVNDLLKSPEKAAEFVRHKKLTSEQASQLFSYDAQLYQENCRLEKECQCLESIEKKITELRNAEVTKFEKEFRTLGLEKQFVEIAWLEIERDKNIPTGIAKWTRELNRDQSRLKQLKTSIFKTKNIKREIQSLEHNIKTWESQKAWEQENLLKTKGKIETAYKIVEEQKQKYHESLVPKNIDELQVNNEHLSQQLQTKSYVKPGDRQEIIQARKNALEIQKRIVQEEITIKADAQKQHEEGYHQQLTIVRDRLNSSQNNCATEEIQQACLTTIEKAFAEKHGLLPREGMDILPEQTDVIKALYQGHEKNQEALIHNIKKINQLAELKSDCIDTCPQAVEYYDSAITFTFDAIEAYRQNNTKDATLLDNYANALCMMGNAMVKTAQCVFSFTKGGATTISENVIGSLNIPQLLQSLGVAGRELFSFIVINGIEENCMRHSMWTEVRAKIAESIGCSQEMVDNLREAATMQSQASQLFAKSTIDMLVEHPEILQNLSSELATEFVNAPLERKFEIAGCLGGHIASFWTTPYALGKIIRGGSFVTQWSTQIARESKTFKSLLLSLQLLYKVETSKMVQFGGKIMSEQVAYALSSLRKTAGPAFAVMTDKQLVHAVFKEISPCTSELERLISSRFPELVVGVNKVEQAVATGVEGIKITESALTEETAMKVLSESKELKQLEQIVEKLNKTNLEYGIAKNKNITSTEYFRLEEQARKLYEQFRTVECDVTKISKNTGIPRKIIIQIKDHMFYAKHNLIQGKDLLFDPDIDIALSWQRLIDDKFVKSDLRLLLHEYSESIILKQSISITGEEMEAHIAHTFANKKHNWQNFA